MAGSTEYVRILEGGRIVIPARFRKALGLKPGDSVTLHLDEGELRITPGLRGIRRAQELLRPYLDGSSLADELIAERRAEAAAEADD